MATRGEKIITLPSGKEVNILFTNRALAMVEGRLNKPITVIATDLINGETGVVVVAQLLKCGVEAALRDRSIKSAGVSLDKVYDIMDQVGFVPVLQVVMEALVECISYDYTAKR